MSVEAHSQQGMKVRVRITACDPSQRLIHGQLKDGGSISIAVFEVPAAFRWPQIGEVWTITRQNLYWILGSRVNADIEEKLPITSLSTDPQLRLDGDTVFDSEGRQFVAVTQSGVLDGDVLIWNTTVSGWRPINLKAYIHSI